MGHLHHRRAEAEIADVGSHRPRELVEPAHHPMGHERSGVAGDGALLREEQQRHLVGLGGELALDVALDQEAGDRVETEPRQQVADAQRVHGRRVGVSGGVGGVDDARGVGRDHVLVGVERHAQAEAAIGLRSVEELAPDVEPAAQGGPPRAFSLERQAVARQQGEHPLVMAVDPLGPALGVLAGRERRPHRADAPAGPRARFEHRHVCTELLEVERGRQAGQAGPHHEDAHLSRR